MAYGLLQTLVERIRQLISFQRGVTEKKVLGFSAGADLADYTICGHCPNHQRRGCTDGRK